MYIRVRLFLFDNTPLLFVLSDNYKFDVIIKYRHGRDRHITYGRRVMVSRQGLRLTINLISDPVAQNVFYVKEYFHTHTHTLTLYVG